MKGGKKQLVIALAVSALVLAVALGVWAYLESVRVPIPGTEMDLFSMGQTQKTLVYYRFGSSRYAYDGYSCTPRVDEKAYTLYFEPMRPLLGRRTRTPEEARAVAADIDVVKNPLAAWDLNGWVADGERLFIELDDIMEIKLVYIGSPEEYRLVWKEGDEIPEMPFDPKTVWENADR